MPGGKFADFARKLRLFASAPIAHLKLALGMVLLHLSDAQMELALSLISDAEERMCDLRVSRAVHLSDGWGV